MVQTTIRMPEKLYCQIKEQAKKARGIGKQFYYYDSV
jgi:hypothetical protein